MYTNLLSRARSGEINAVASSFLDLIIESEHNDPVLTLLSEKLKSDNQDLTTALNHKEGNDKTSEVWLYEGFRDKSLKCFFLTVQGATYRNNEEIAQQASIIYEVIKRHGRSMYNLPMLEQSSKMESLFDELASDKLKAALNSTGTKDHMEEVKLANEKFLQSMSERSKEEAGKIVVVHVTESRKAVKVNLEKILSYLDTRTSIEEALVLEQLKAELNEVITSANSTIKSRQSRKDNDLAA